MLGGGRDQRWLEPLDPEGNRDMDTPTETMGCHVGPYAGLNVGNPQTGYVYSWANDDPRDTLIARQWGGQVVQAGDPEHAMYAEMIGNDTTPMDSAEMFPGVVLIRTPIEKERERRESEEAKNQNMLKAAGEDFTSRTTVGEQQVSQTDGRGPTRFRRADFGLDYENTGGQVVQQWRPGSGIVKER